jgi:hypothetical protein
MTFVLDLLILFHTHKKEFMALICLRQIYKRKKGKEMRESSTKKRSSQDKSCYLICNKIDKKQMNIFVDKNIANLHQFYIDQRSNNDNKTRLFISSIQIMVRSNQWANIRAYSASMYTHIIHRSI